jgi:hypothetical protein
MLVKRVSFNDFVKEFEEFGREEQFSFEGKKALYNYLNELGEDIGNIELDIIGLCCDFTEYSSIEEFNHDYQLELNDIDDVQDYTTVIQIDGNRFIIQAF